MAKASELILSARVGKHPDQLIEELVVSTEGKTAPRPLGLSSGRKLSTRRTSSREWDTDGWGGYERVFTPEVDHSIGKALTQLNERTNGILRQQTGRWHRRQNKFGEV